MVPGRRAAQLPPPTKSAIAWRLGLVQTGNMVYTLLGYRVTSFAAATPPQAGSNRHLLGARASRPHSVPADASSPASASGLRGRSPQSSRWGDNYLTPEESKETLLSYRNNFVPTSTPWLADNERPTLRQARLNGPGAQHVRSRDAVSSPSGHSQGISETPRPVFPVIQQRPRFSRAISRCPPNVGATLVVARLFAVARRRRQGHRARIHGGKSEPVRIYCWRYGFAGADRSWPFPAWPHLSPSLN